MRSSRKICCGAPIRKKNREAVSETEIDAETIYSLTISQQQKQQFFRISYVQ